MTQATLPLFGPRPNDEWPLIYVATRLTRLEPDERLTVEGWCYVISEVVAQFTAEDPPWFARVHLPVKRSAPWINDGRTPSDVYELNSGVIWRDVHALIVLTYKGGSRGAGNELTMAASLGLPTLVAVHDSEPLSRHVEGLANEHMIPCETFTAPEGLRDIVDRWLRRERRRIADGPRRRRTRAARLTGMVEVLDREWRRLGPNGRREVMAHAGMAGTRIERILTCPEHLDAASVHELASLPAPSASILSGPGLERPCPTSTRCSARRSSSPPTSTAGAAAPSWSSNEPPERNSRSRASGGSV